MSEKKSVKKVHDQKTVIRHLSSRQLGELIHKGATIAHLTFIIDKDVDMDTLRITRQITFKTKLVVKDVDEMSKEVECLK